MNPKFIKWGLLSTMAVTLALVAFTIFHFCWKEKTAYVDLGSVFNGFKYKSQVDQEYNTMLTSRGRILDSLEAAVISAQNNNDTLRARQLADDYYAQQDQFSKESSTLSADLTQKVWTQLTQYINDYASEHDYTYVFGGKGDGNLLFAKDYKNITEDVLAYVNGKYEDDH